MPGLDPAARALVRAAMQFVKASDLSEIPAALVNVLLDIPDWSGIREKLAKSKAETRERARRPH